MVYWLIAVVIALGYTAGTEAAHAYSVHGARFIKHSPQHGYNPDHVDISVLPLTDPNRVHTVSINANSEDVQHPIQTIGYVPIIIPTADKAHAVSSASKTTVHNSIEHIVTKDNKRIPVVVQKISRHQHNITHAPVELPQVIGYVPDSIVNYLAHHKLAQIPTSTTRRTVDVRIKDYNDNPFRKPIGGYGVGYNSGGPGAGHGFWSNDNNALLNTFG